MTTIWSWNAPDQSVPKYTQMAKPIAVDRVERQPNGKYRLVKHPNRASNNPRSRPAPARS